MAKVFLALDEKAHQRLVDLVTETKHNTIHRLQRENAAKADIEKAIDGYEELAVALGTEISLSDLDEAKAQFP